jgi:hypothetical protein
MVQQRLAAKYGAATHWAKLELPVFRGADSSGVVGGSVGDSSDDARVVDSAALQQLRVELARRYPVDKVMVAV